MLSPFNVSVTRPGASRRAFHNNSKSFCNRPRAFISAVCMISCSQITHSPVQRATFNWECDRVNAPAPARKCTFRAQLCASVRKQTAALIRRQGPARCRFAARLGSAPERRNAHRSMRRNIFRSETGCATIAVGRRADALEGIVLLPTRRSSYYEPV